MRPIGPVLAFGILAADQVSKWYVTEHVFRGIAGLGDPMRLGAWLQHAPQRMADATLTLTSFLNLTMVWNQGISFGLMTGGGAGLLTISSLVIAAFFFIWMLRAHALFEIASLALIIGGALGNVVDRVRFGAVVDFLLFHYGNWAFPAFNVADSAISVGVAGLLIHSLFFAKKTV
jgi:signal peptidase II